ncbi:MAG: hypothetical protein QOC92_2241, partial [Acidimicrobiaceae bacterium]
MRVLLVNDHAPGPGSGTEVHVARVASALREAGDEVAVFAGEVVHRGPAKVRDVWDPVARRKLATVARRFQPDVVHHHNVVRELSVSVLGIPRSVAQVLTVHDYRMLRANEGPAGSSTLGPMLWAKSVKGKLDRAIVRRRVDVVIAVSSGLAEGLREAGLPRVTTVENFADPEPCWTAPTGDELLCAGRLSNEKGLDVLIEAFAAVIRGGTAARLRVVGTGPAEATLRALAARLAPGRVVFEGLVSESRVRELMRAARAVCVPSNVNEGAGLV